MWKLDYRENWTLKNWCFLIVMLEKTLESSLDWKEIQPVNPKGNKSWIFIEMTYAEAEAPILWPCNEKYCLTGKDPYAGKDWRGGEGDDRGWDVWMASLTWWTWVWASSGSWWWTGKPGVLQSMGSQRVGHYWGMELNWTDCFHSSHFTTCWKCPQSWYSSGLAVYLWIITGSAQRDVDFH